MNPAYRILSLSFLLLLPACEKKEGAGSGLQDASQMETGKSGREERISSRSRNRGEEEGMAVEKPPATAGEKAGTLCESDPAAALKWANERTDPAERAAALEAVAWRAALEDLPIAVDAMEAMSPGEARNRLAGHLVAEWATRDHESALVWAKARGEETERNEALYGWIVATGDQAPERAGAMAADEVTPGPVQNRAVVSVIQRWAAKDATAAAAWVETFPDGSLKNDARQVLDAAIK